MPLNNTIPTEFQKDTHIEHVIECTNCAELSEVNRPYWLHYSAKFPLRAILFQLFDKQILYQQDNSKNGEIMESPIMTEKFEDGVKKVGPGSKFWYRYIYDPISPEELKKIERNVRNGRNLTY